MTDTFQKNDPQDLLNDLDFNTKRRRDLLPTWIKVFCWFFMFFGIAAAFCFILGLFGYKPELEFYGFKTNEVFSINGLLVISIGILKGITAYALWFEKDYAVILAKIDAYFGIVLCGISMLILPFFANEFILNVRLELALLIPFLLKMNKIENQWEGK